MMRSNQKICAIFAFLLFVIPMSETSAAAIAGQGTWQTTLEGRDLDGDGMSDAFYDTTLRVTWLGNASSNGSRTWDDQMRWASLLNIGGVTGWRLPATRDLGDAGCTSLAFSGTDCGYNVDVSVGSGINSEMAHLFYVTLGNLACVDRSGNGGVVGCGLVNTANFSGFRQDFYWSGTSDAGLPQLQGAWQFSTLDRLDSAGFQNVRGKIGLGFALAVHDGDVGTRVSTVPLPSTAALFLLSFLLFQFTHLVRKFRQ